MFGTSRLTPICFLLLVGSLLAAQSIESASTAANNIADGDWPNYDRNYTGDRYSPLSEITAKNVTTLQPLCTL